MRAACERHTDRYPVYGLVMLRTSSLTSKMSGMFLLSFCLRSSCTIFLSDCTRVRSRLASCVLLMSYRGSMTDPYGDDLLCRPRTKERVHACGNRRAPWTASLTLEARIGYFFDAAMVACLSPTIDFSEMAAQGPDRLTAHYTLRVPGRLFFCIALFSRAPIAACEAFNIHPSCSSTTKGQKIFRST